MKIANFEIADQHMNAKWVKAQLNVQLKALTNIFVK